MAKSTKVLGHVQKAAPELLTDLLPVDMFYGIAKHLGTKDIVHLVQLDASLHEVAEYHLSRRLIKLHFKSRKARLQMLADYVAPFVKLVDLGQCRKGMGLKLAQFLAACPRVEEMRIAGYCNIEQSGVPVGRFEHLRKLTLVSLNERGIADLCIRSDTGNLETLRLEKFYKIGRYLNHLPTDVRNLELDLCSDQDSGLTWTYLGLYVRRNPHLQRLSVEYLHQGHRYGCVDVDELIENLQELQHLRLEVIRPSYPANCAQLAQLERLVTLDLCFQQPQLVEYLNALRPSAQLPLQKLNIRISEIDGETIPWAQLGALRHLDDLAISFDTYAANMHCLKLGLATYAPQLRKLAVHFSSHGRALMALSADWVAASFPLLESLRIELLPHGLPLLAELAHLRSLDVIINMPLNPGWPVRQWRQNAEVGRMLVAFGQHASLRQLAIGSNNFETPIRLGRWTLARVREWKKSGRIQIEGTGLTGLPRCMREFGRREDRFY